MLTSLLKATSSVSCLISMPWLLKLFVKPLVCFISMTKIHLILSSTLSIAKTLLPSLRNLLLTKWLNLLRMSLIYNILKLMYSVNPNTSSIKNLSSRTKMACSLLLLVLLKILFFAWRTLFLLTSHLFP